MRTKMGRSTMIAALLACAAACSGGSGAGDGDAAPDLAADETAGGDAAEDPAAGEAPADGSCDGAAPDAPAPSGRCASRGYDLRAGWNEGFVSNGRCRSFILLLPPGVSAAGGPWPVAFFWHGVSNHATQLRSIAEDVAGAAGSRFVAVLPEAIPMEFPDGFAWDMLMMRGTPNEDLALFDDVLACLDEAFGVDDARVHSMGFSAGAIMTDLLSIARSEVVASVASCSGAYFCDEKEAIYGTVWPPYAVTDKFTALVVWGGPADVYRPWISFNDTSTYMVEYLGANGHDVVACTHDLGHELPPGLAGAQLFEFFRDHPKGSHPSPWVAGGLPADYPPYCRMRPAE